MNNENLIRNEDLTPEERRERASKAGKASVEARRRKKALRECLSVLLEKEYVSESGGKASGAELISVKLFRRAVDGEIRAFEVIRDTIGEMPTQRMEIDTIDPQARAEMDELLGIGGQNDGH